MIDFIEKRYCVYDNQKEKKNIFEIKIIDTL